MPETAAVLSLDTCALYRYFDAGDRLLYVGISGDLATRDKSHIASSKWMQFTARSAVERYKTRDDVKVAERETIETERPLFNKVYNNTPEARERLYVYLEEIGRLDLMTDGQRAAVLVERMRGPKRLRRGRSEQPRTRHGVNKTPLIGWHSQDPSLKPWLENEASVRGVTLREYLDEVLASHRAARETETTETGEQ